MNKVLEDLIRHYISFQQDNWDDLLSAAEFAINNAYQESIGDTPFYLNFRRHPRLPTDCSLAKKPSKDPSAADYIGNIQKAIVKAKRCLQAAQQRQKKYADKHRTERHFQVGDMVWLNGRHITLKAVGVCKFLPLWLGPFAVLAKVSPVNYTLGIPANYHIHTTFHVSMLCPVHDNGGSAGQPPIIMVDGEEEFELQIILQHSPGKHTGDSRIRYLVSWKGYGPAYPARPEAAVLRGFSLSVHPGEVVFMLAHVYRSDSQTC